MAIAWPSSTLPYRHVMFARRSLSRSGGLTITGVEQVVASSSDFWAATIGFRIHRTSQILAYRALQAQQWGRAAEWIIPACPRIGVPASPPAYDVSWSDDWADDFSTGPAPTSIPPGEGALVTTSATRGAHSITFQFQDAGFTPLAGMFFSIGNRLYSIGTATLTGVRTYTVAFAPGLRAAAPINSVVEFSSPRCLMRLAEDNVGQLDLDMLRFSDQTLNFVEVPA